MKRRLSLAVKNRLGHESKVTVRRKLASRRVGLQRRQLRRVKTL
jgi:hypothetical protein